MAEYETFLKHDLSDLKEGEQIIEVRDRQTYEMRKVKAVVSSSSDKLSSSEKLWVIWPRGRIEPKPWAIKIIEDTGTTLGSIASEWL